MHLRQPQGVTEMLSPGTFATAEPNGTQVWIDMKRVSHNHDDPAVLISGMATIASQVGLPEGRNWSK